MPKPLLRTPLQVAHEIQDKWLSSNGSHADLLVAIATAIEERDAAYGKTLHRCGTCGSSLHGCTGKRCMRQLKLP